MDVIAVRHRFIIVARLGIMSSFTMRITAAGAQDGLRLAQRQSAQLSAD